MCLAFFFTKWLSVRQPDAIIVAIGPVASYTHHLRGRILSLWPVADRTVLCSGLLDHRYLVSMVGPC